MNGSRQYKTRHLTREMVSFVDSLLEFIDLRESLEFVACTPAYHPTKELAEAFVQAYEKNIPIKKIQRLFDSEAKERARDLIVKTFDNFVWAHEFSLAMTDMLWALKETQALIQEPSYGDTEYCHLLNEFTQAFMHMRQVKQHIENADSLIRRLDYDANHPEKDKS